MSSAVIQSKLAVPPLGERLAARPRVSGLVAELLERHPLVLVTATAGAGKTTAVVQAAALLDRPVAWLTLDDTDAAPGRLLTYLEAALARRAPAASDVATNALAARIPHAEAAGLLAEATAGVPMLLVVDGLERLAGHDAALAVIGALVRYAPPTPGDRAAQPLDVGVDLGDRGAVGTRRDASARRRWRSRPRRRRRRSSAPGGRASTRARRRRHRRLGDRRALRGLAVGRPRPGRRRRGRPAARLPRDADPVAPDAAERELLEVTSMLDEVTAERAEALGIAGAGELLVGLRARHLPVAWEQDRRCMRPHPRFREYLLERLGRRAATEVRGLRRAHGELLLTEGHHEEAAEELLRAGAPDEALAPAEQAIRRVVERLDFAVAERWLRELEPVAGTSDRLTSAELMLAISLEDFRRGARIADRLARAGERDRLARSSPLSGSMMAWCLWHSGASTTRARSSR